MWYAYQMDCWPAVCSPSRSDLDLSSMESAHTGADAPQRVLTQRAMEEGGWRSHEIPWNTLTISRQKGWIPEYVSIFKRPGIHGMNYPPQTGTGFQDWTVRNNKSQIEITLSLDKGTIMATISTPFCPQQTYMCKILWDESPQTYVSYLYLRLWPHHILLNAISWMHLCKWIWNDKR